MVYDINKELSFKNLTHEILRELLILSQDKETALTKIKHA